jgi:CRP-like cAMP-binding protein
VHSINQQRAQYYILSQKIAFTQK